MTADAAVMRKHENDEILVGRPDDVAMTTHLLESTWRPMGKVYWALLGVTSLGAGGLVMLLLYTAMTGIGVWGNNIPVAWAFGIVNFVWWIGIGHAGTFISAILYLLEQRWRTSINRFTEGMTIFAVLQAGLFPVFHTGRPWFAYWLFPYPSTMQVWPQLRSALPWDAAAVSTYLTISVLFWFLGLVPDFATLRDRAPSRRARVAYGILALGWRGSARDWNHYRLAYLLLAGLAAPLVLSVHSVVSLDFAITNVPGWHSTSFPPYFVAGAIFSGFAMVLTLIIPARAIFGLKDVITARHLDLMAKVMFATGWIVIYAYALEAFLSWFSGDRYELWSAFHARPFGPGNVVFWLQILGNVVVPQVLWSRRVRFSPVALFVVSLFVQLGMWAERFTIIVQNLQEDYLPSSWSAYRPTWVDLGILFGTICFFLFLFLLFLRFMPFVPVSEMKEMAHEMRHEEKHA